MLVPDKPVKTVRRANPMTMKHYSLERCLTVREYARSQSFPDDFQFNGPISEKRKQSSNAVPLHLGRVVARAFMDSHMDYYHGRAVARAVMDSHMDYQHRYAQHHLQEYMVILNHIHVCFQSDKNKHIIFPYCKKEQPRHLR